MSVTSAHGQQIVDLVEIALLLLNLQVHRIKPFDPRLHLGRNPVFDHFFADRFLDFAQKLVKHVLLRGNLLLQFEKGVGFEVPERQILKLAANQAHAQTVRDRSVYVEGFASNTLLASSTGAPSPPVCVCVCVCVCACWRYSTSAC